MSPATIPVIAGRIHWPPKPRIVSGSARPIVCTHWPKGVSRVSRSAGAGTPRTRNGPSDAQRRPWPEPGSCRDSFTSSTRQTTRTPAMPGPRGRPVVARLRLQVRRPAFGGQGHGATSGFASPVSWKNKASRGVRSSSRPRTAMPARPRASTKASISSGARARSGRRRRDWRPLRRPRAGATASAPRRRWCASARPGRGPTRAALPAARRPRPCRGQDRRAVADLLDLGHVVAAENHGHAVPGQAAQRRPQVTDARRVHAVGGLVQDQQPGRRSMAAASPSRCRIPRE